MKKFYTILTVIIIIFTSCKNNNTDKDADITIIETDASENYQVIVSFDNREAYIQTVKK
jgi:hypothetical protein